MPVSAMLASTIQDTVMSLRVSTLSFYVIIFRIISFLQISPLSKVYKCPIKRSWFMVKVISIISFGYDAAFYSFCFSRKVST